MDDREIRLRLIEAAAKAPNAHPKGFAEGVLEQAALWEEFVTASVTADEPLAQAELQQIGKAATAAYRAKLGLPKKG
jgi:hypothetical protein